MKGRVGTGTGSRMRIVRRALAVAAVATSMVAAASAPAMRNDAATAGQMTATASSGQTPAPQPVPDVKMPTDYIAMGKVPVTGMQVGATFYGACASPVKGHYVVSNLRQGGTKCGGAYNGYDDNGIGACGGRYNNLTNQVTWAEDGMGKILGDLPCGTKLLIQYRGHWIVAAKGDISGGGGGGRVDGHIRAVDLWWQSAKALCFSNQPGVVTIHVLPRNTPVSTVVAYNRNVLSTYSICH